MVAASFAAEDTASTVLALSKAAWKLGGSLSKLDQDFQIADTAVRGLAGEVKSLSIECDQVYGDLEGASSNGKRSLPYDVDHRVLSCTGTQVEEISRTLQELEMFVRSVREAESDFTGPVLGQNKLDESSNQIASIRTSVCRHTESLRATLLLTNRVFVPSRGDRNLAKELDKLRDMYGRLRRSSEADAQWRSSRAEATLIQCAHEVIMELTTMYEANKAMETISGGEGTANSSFPVVEWVNILESIRQDQRRSYPSDVASDAPSIFSGDEAHTAMANGTSGGYPVREYEANDALVDGSDDGLDMDLARAALETGTKAFDAQKWEEADSLFQESLRLLRQLPKQQRRSCDTFSLQYKLAVCAFHTQEPVDAEEALLSLAQQSASSDEQRGHMHSVTHLLSLLYIRMGQVDRARSECEKALHARRRLLGKQSDASLESIVLLAHIFFLLNNSARAKSYLAMIPETRRDDVIRTVEESLGTKVEKSPSVMTRSTFKDSDLAVTRIQSRLSAASLALPMDNTTYSPVHGMISQSPAPSLRQLQQLTPSDIANSENVQFVMVKSPLVDERRASLAPEKERPRERYSANLAAPVIVAPRPAKLLQTNETSKGKVLSRKDILEKMGCQPKDKIEEAVCGGDQAIFANLLNKKEYSWQSKFRKHLGRPERVTALHFAALFGEIHMARRLLASGFNINEVPYGYSERLTPLKFAIGAREVGMAEFLIANGARPSTPDSWSTLPAQLMNRSWLVKTMSEAGKELVPGRMIAILRMLIKQGWDVKSPYDESKGTILHQAVAFWTGSCRWDLDLRAAVTSFLCEFGADPFRPNAEGKTPYDIALSSGHQDLIQVLDRGSIKNELETMLVRPAELSG